MGKRILVIADDEELLECVQAALERDGYQVQASRTGICFQQEVSEFGRRFGQEIVCEVC